MLRYRRTNAVRPGGSRGFPPEEETAGKGAARNTERRVFEGRRPREWAFVHRRPDQAYRYGIISGSCTDPGDGARSERWAFRPESLLVYRWVFRICRKRGCKACRIRGYVRDIFEVVQGQLAGQRVRR